MQPNHPRALLLLPLRIWRGQLQRVPASHFPARARAPGNQSWQLSALSSALFSSMRSPERTE